MRARERAAKAQLFGFHAATAISATMNAAYDDLPGVSVSRLRALGDITEDMNVATVKLDEVRVHRRPVAVPLAQWWVVVVFCVPVRPARPDPSAVRRRSRLLPVP